MNTLTKKKSKVAFMKIVNPKSTSVCLFNNEGHFICLPPGWVGDVKIEGDTSVIIGLGHISTSELRKVSICEKLN